jgi:hypothetical protein
MCDSHELPMRQEVVFLPGLTVLAAWCFSCGRKDPNRTALHAFLMQRYGVNEKE